jgi:hypothetical protein
MCTVLENVNPTKTKKVVNQILIVILDISVPKIHVMPPLKEPAPNATAKRSVPQSMNLFVVVMAEPMVTPVKQPDLV